jgi:hypothetical protein
VTRLVKRFSRATAEHGALHDAKHTVEDTNYFVTTLRIDHASIRLPDPVYKSVSDRFVIK